VTFPLYSKINSIKKRHQDGPLKGQFLDEWAVPEFEYLADNQWIWREKIDGRNTRIHVKMLGDGADKAVCVDFGGRTNKAEMPKPLLECLQELFHPPALDHYQSAFDEECLRDGITLFGEGYGAGIQSGGAYGPVDFILFDVLIGTSWMTEESTTDIAYKLGLRRVPLVATGTLHDAIDAVKHGYLASDWDGVEPEGLVCVPAVPLFDRRGHRILTKVKGKDFK
jgi:hypothetical protein